MPFSTSFSNSPFPRAELLPGAICEMLADVAYTGILYEGDRYGLMLACCDDSLPDEERRAIDRLIRFIVRGKIQIA